ncbi:hypothetical protein D3C86_1844380 [compost metagenome]
MVPHLGSVVEDAARRLLHDGFQRVVLELGALDQVVQVRDVGLVVLVMMELQGFLGDVRSQGIMRVRERGELVFHCSVSRFGVGSCRL